MATKVNQIMAKEGDRNTNFFFTLSTINRSGLNKTEKIKHFEGRLVGRKLAIKYVVI